MSFASDAYLVLHRIALRSELLDYRSCEEEATPRRFPPPPRPFSADARRWTLAKGRGTGGRALEGTRVRAMRPSARELSSVLVLESRIWNTGRARG